jgi:hypothetical protein
MHPLAIAGLAISQSLGPPCKEQPEMTVVPVHLFTSADEEIFAFLLHGSKPVLRRLAAR